MKTPKFATAYENRIKNQLDCSDTPTLTQQQYKDECDINNILKRYEKTHLLPDFIKENPQYGDFSEVPTYQEALDIIHVADTQFGLLDAKTRDRFSNNPAKFLEFVHNPDNIKEMVSMGLATLPEPHSEPVVTLTPEVKQ
ncbi:MAG: internal scaffolding protein [Microvirus sp.]|nr:MAG: internal scaffolding protein [Microvirus sp.]